MLDSKKQQTHTHNCFMNSLLTQTSTTSSPGQKMAVYSSDTAIKPYLRLHAFSVLHSFHILKLQFL